MGEGSEGGDVCVDRALVGAGEIFGIRGGGNEAMHRGVSGGLDVPVSDNVRIGTGNFKSCRRGALGTAWLGLAGRTV